MVFRRSTKSHSSWSPPVHLRQAKRKEREKEQEERKSRQKELERQQDEASGSSFFEHFFFF